MLKDLGVKCHCICNAQANRIRAKIVYLLEGLCSNIKSPLSTDWAEQAKFPPGRLKGSPQLDGHSPCWVPRGAQRGLR